MNTIPTLSSIRSGLISDVEAQLGVTITSLGPTFLSALIDGLAGKLYLYYLSLGDVQKNIFADTADPESMGGTLERFGRVKLGRSPFPAIAGEYTVQVSGITGAIIPAETTFKSDDSSLSPGKLYILDNEFILDGVNIITLRAMTPGIEGKLLVGNTLTCTTPIALVATTPGSAEILTESNEPQAAEDIEEYRQKVLDAFQLEPQGGSASDYRLWAADVQGVEQSYPYVVAGNSNQINLFVEAVLADSIDGEGTPSAGMLSEVQASVEDPTDDRPGRKPLGVYQVNYLPVVVLQVAIEVADYVGLTADIENLIQAAITAELFKVRPFIGAIDPVSKKNDIFDVNKIVSLIIAAKPGSIFGAVSMEVAGNPVSTYEFDNGEIPHLSSITFV